MLYKNIDYQKSNALHTIMKPYPNMVGLTSTNLQPKCNKKVYFMLKIGLRNVLYIYWLPKTNVHETLSKHTLKITLKTTLK